MNNLHRELAPISDAAWAEIEKETARTLKRYLAGRRVVDASGRPDTRFAVDFGVPRLPDLLDDRSCGNAVAAAAQRLGRRQFALDARFQLLQRQLLQIGLRGAGRSHRRNLGSGAAVDGGHLHDIADRNELEINLVAIRVGHGQASTTT